MASGANSDPFPAPGLLSAMDSLNPVCRWPHLKSLPDRASTRSSKSIKSTQIQVLGRLGLGRIDGASSCWGRR